ncbi:MAG: mismatch-specific DNA-glycosylase [Dehalococcoidia bacterium]|nr:mismatch-specific DNA-glycosylase [Dehalococcoidia bacterium]
MTDLPPPLPQLLSHGLRIVFIGYNPAIYSAERGHYYARPGNAFWKQLSATSLVERPVTCEDDALLPSEAGIGFTDLCPRPTVRAEELTRDEVREGATSLYDRLVRFQPAIAVFSGRGIFDYFARFALELPPRHLRGRGYGPQPERMGETVPWVIPSSSGLASRWHRERQELMHCLAAEAPHWPSGPQ